MPYVGEIRMFAGKTAPDGWSLCDGELLPISENAALFELIGTTYGGDGQVVFGLPDLRGRLPIHQSATHPLGERGGAEEVQLGVEEMPRHGHTAMGAAVTGDQTIPEGQLPANSVTITPYLNADPDTPFNAGAIDMQGGDQPHTNLQPYLGLSFIICLEGVFPQAGE